MSTNATHRRMVRNGWKAFHLWCTDDNGGLPLVKRWHILQHEAPTKAGLLIGGHDTRAEAWRAAEDWYSLEHPAPAVGTGLRVTSSALAKLAYDRRKQGA